MVVLANPILEAGGDGVRPQESRHDQPTEARHGNEHHRAITLPSPNLDQDEEHNGENKEADEQEGEAPYRSRRVRANSDL